MVYREIIADYSQAVVSPQKGKRQQWIGAAIIRSSFSGDFNKQQGGIGATSPMPPELKESDIIPEIRKSKITMPLKNRPPTRYNGRGNPACQRTKGGYTPMASPYRTVHATLQNNRGVWVVSGRVYDPNIGKSRQRTKSTGFKVKDCTKRKALEAMREIVAMWEDGANAAPIKRDPLFSEYAEKWLQTKESTARANTALSYRQYLDIHILPAFGDYKVQEITRQMLQDFCNEKLKKLSVNSVKKIFVPLNGALDDAVIDDIIPANPGKNIKFPQAKKFEGAAYTPEQVARLLEGAEAEGEPMHCAIILAVVYGLRRSEICGLRWQDIVFPGSRSPIGLA